MGCFRNGSHPKEVWVKVVGLPLHLWSRKGFKSIRERCGGFIAVDEETAFFSELQWARILVRTSGKFRPGTLQVAVGNFCWTVSLWWENPPWFSEVVARSAWFKDERQEVKDEGGGDTRASVSVREVQNFQFDMQSRGTGEQVVCGRRQREAAVALAAKDRLPSVADLDSSCGGFGPRKENGKAFKENGCLGLSGEVVWAKGPLSVSLEETGWGGSPRPTFNKAGMGFLERPSSARAPSVPAGSVGGMDAELLAIKVAIAADLLSRRWRVTVEAVMEEASMYYAVPNSSSSLGLRESSSYSSLRPR